MTHLQIRLYRDSFNTPWGFRLQGGKDLAQTLSVQRVFSNSPAEGELQRGDFILAINGRDANELTHKQALDLIKHGGGQIQLVLQRPAHGQMPQPASFKPQRPRAPALQLSPVYPSAQSSARSRDGRLEMLHESVNPCYNPHFLQQYAPSSHSTPPSWSAHKFEPKKVSKLSRLGGGGVDLGVDYGAKYRTLPRRRHSTQVSSSVPQLQSAGGNPARVASLSHLGGGGFDFGTNYCTLPRKQPWRPKSPTPATGFQPRKITLSNFGGGTTDFGRDYGRPGGALSQPVSVQTGGRGPGHNVDMLNKVQESLDNISLSPRTPDYGYQAPAFPPPLSPAAQPYVPTGVRLDMEREEEERRKQQQRSYKPYVPTSVKIDQEMALAGKPLNPRSPAPAPWRRQEEPDRSGPAWKSTLRATGVKPWDADLDYVPGQQQAPPHSSFQPGQPATPYSPAAAAPYSPAPFNPAPAAQGQQDGPQVVHLQYNSPMGLYSRENVQETYAGQTRAMAASGGLSPGGSQAVSPGQGADRDWNQSAVFRMIHDQDSRRGPPQRSPRTQAPAYQQSFSPNVDEFGTSDF